jgi:hypothetical protein
MNTIALDQDSPRFQKLLMARQKFYADATALQILQLITTVVIPVAGAVLAVFAPQARAYVALYGLVVTALDVMWIDREQRRVLKIAAKISEEFDCGVLQMPWNVFTAGKRVDVETVDAASRKWKGSQESIKDWYRGISEQSPLPLARVVCQRMNLQYDASLRRTYGKLLILGAVVALVGFIVGTVLRDLKLLEFIAVATTVSPALVWAVREQFRQSDAAAANEILKNEAEKLLDQVDAGACPDTECETRSREFQDAIFGRRVANPLIFPLVYKFMRPELEKQAKAGAEAFLK